MKEKISEGRHAKSMLQTKERHGSRLTSAATFPLPLGWAFCWLQLLTRSRYLFAP